MEVEIPIDSPNGSCYWEIALVADNSHVVHLDVQERAPKMGAYRSVLSLLMPQPTSLVGKQKPAKSALKTDYEDG